MTSGLLFGMVVLLLLLSSSSSSSSTTTIIHTVYIPLKLPAMACYSLWFQNLKMQQRDSLTKLTIANTEFAFLQQTIHEILTEYNDTSEIAQIIFLSL
jgi:hypothetical protein